VKPDNLKFDPLLLKAVAQGSTKIENSFLAIERNANDLYRVYYMPTARIAQLGAKKAMGATFIEELQAAISSFQILTGKRLAEQYVSLIELLNHRRLYAAALTTRAIIEVTASVVYFDASIIPSLTKGIRSRQEMDDLAALIEKHLRAGRFDWKRWLGESKFRDELIKEYADKKDEPKPEILQTNVVTMIKYLDDRVSLKDQSQKGMIKLIYAVLSDICHPAVGAHILLLANRSADGWYVADSEPTDELLRWYCLNTTVPVLERIHDVIKDCFYRLRYVAETLQTKPT